MGVYYVSGVPFGDELYHHGIKGQKWGVRRYQNEDGSLTDAGKKKQKKIEASVERGNKLLEKNRTRAGAIGRAIGRQFLLRGAQYAAATLAAVGSIPLTAALGPAGAAIATAGEYAVLGTGTALTVGNVVKGARQFVDISRAEAKGNTQKKYRT